MLVLQQPTQKAIAVYTPLPDEKEGVKISAQVISSFVVSDPVKGNIPAATHGETITVQAKLTNTSPQELTIVSLSYSLQVFDENGGGVYGWLTIADFAPSKTLKPNEEIVLSERWAVNLMEDSNP
ncbi:MAG: hypothetical protein QXP61_01125 [Nitrososphaerales archaeon]